MTIRNPVAHLQIASIDPVNRRKDPLSLDLYLADLPTAARERIQEAI